MVLRTQVVKTREEGMLCGCLGKVNVSHFHLQKVNGFRSHKKEKHQIYSHTLSPRSSKIKTFPTQIMPSIYCYTSHSMPFSFPYSHSNPPPSQYRTHLISAQPNKLNSQRKAPSNSINAGWRRSFNYTYQMNALSGLHVCLELQLTSA